MNGTRALNDPPSSSHGQQKPPKNKKLKKKAATTEEKKYENSPPGNINITSLNSFGGGDTTNSSGYAGIATGQQEVSPLVLGH